MSFGECPTKFASIHDLAVQDVEVIGDCHLLALMLTSENSKSHCNEKLYESLKDLVLTNKTQMNIN